MLNAKVRNKGDCTRSACGGERAEVRNQMTEIRDQRESCGQRAGASVDGVALSRHQLDTDENTVTPECGCDFVLHDSDGELLMREECPEIGGEG